MYAVEQLLTCVGVEACTTVVAHHATLKSSTRVCVAVASVPAVSCQTWLALWPYYTHLVSAHQAWH